MEATTENKTAWSWMGFIFSTAYYAGYGKMKKAFALFGIMVVGVNILPILSLAVLNMPVIVGQIITWATIIGISVYTGLNARKDLPIKEIPFSWKDFILYVLAVVVVSFAISFVLLLVFAGALMSAGADAAASMSTMQ